MSRVIITVCYTVKSKEMSAMMFVVMSKVMSTVMSTVICTIVYAIMCTKEKCNEVYIGETERMLKFRLADHRGYVLNSRTDKSTGNPFNRPGHSLADLRVAAIEHNKGRNSEYRKKR